MCGWKASKQHQASLRFRQDPGIVPPRRSTLGDIIDWGGPSDVAEAIDKALGMELNVRDLRRRAESFAAESFTARLRALLSSRLSSELRESLR